MTVSAGKSSTQRTRGLFGGSNLLLLAIALFGLSVRTNSPGAGLAALVATVALGRSIFLSRKEESTPEKRRPSLDTPILGVAVGFGLLGAVGWAHSTVGPTNELLERIPGIAWAAIAIALLAMRRRLTFRLLAISTTVTTLLVTLIVGLAHLREVEGVGLDVNLLHIAAANAIAEGENPYTDAVVVPNGSPTAEPGDTINGYPYPPVTAIAYSIGEWLFNDPRYTSLISWLLVLGLIGVDAIRRRDGTGVALMLLLASVPGWPLLLRAAWTEPLSLLFMAAALLTWRSRWSSGLNLGFALASKQYFVVTAPVALLHRDEEWRRRSIVAAVVVITTIGTALFLDFEAFWSAAVEFHMNTPPRQDSSNLLGLAGALGLSWSPPAIFSLVLGLAVAALAGWSSRSARDFLLAMACSLAASFLVASQAFANYWFLLFGLSVLAMTRGRAGMKAGTGVA